jgi:biotin synthesis protein BioG
MKTYIRRSDKNDNLIVFYADWGADENLFTALCSSDSDHILFYNYSANEALVLPEPKTYKSVVLIGWSLGVWAAEHLSIKTGIKPDLTIAVNGTPLPADDHYGIPENIFEGTLNNVTEKSMGKFYLRMFGNKSTYMKNTDRLPGRSNKSLHDELRWLYNRTMEQTEPGFRWDYAVMSTDDRVFPTKNLIGYWDKRKETKLIKVPFPHYLFYKWNSFGDFVSFVKTFRVENQVKNDLHPIEKT